MKTGNFYIGLIGILITSIVFSILMVRMRAEDELKSIYIENNRVDASLTARLIREQLETRLTLIEALAKQDIILNVVMGSALETGEVQDLLQYSEILSKPIYIKLYDFLGQELVPPEQELSSNIGEERWFQQVMQNDGQPIILEENYNKSQYLKVAWPIMYSGMSEGVLVVLLDNKLSEIFDVSQVDNVELEIRSPFLDYATETDFAEYEDLIEFPIEGTELVLSYHVDGEALNTKSSIFMKGMMIAISLSLALSFFIIGVAAKQLLLNPFERLRQSERQLRQSKQQQDLLSKAIEATPIAVTIADPDQDDMPLTYINKAFTDITGYSIDETIGSNCRFLQGPETEQKIVRRITDGIIKKETFSVEIINYKKSGEKIWLKLSLSPVFDDDKNLRAYIGIQQDITESKLKEEELIKAKRAAEESTRAKSQFLANMSHEIRTPMNGVLGMINLALLRDDIDNTLQHQLNLAKSSAESLLDVINDILDFSKIEAGELHLEAIQFDMLGLLSDFAESISMQSSEKGISLILDTVNVAISELIGDVTRVRQILTNTVGNAIKFTNEGHVKITASTQVKDDAILLTVIVSDTGVGIDASNINSLFEPFKQADGSTTRKFGGTGLGLTICRKLCEQMGGSIHIHSELGKGTDVTIQLTLLAANPKDIESNGLDLDLTDLRVLVIGERPEAADVMQDQLETWDAKVSFCDLQEVEVKEALQQGTYTHVFIAITDSLSHSEIVDLIKTNNQEAEIIAVRGINQSFTDSDLKRFGFTKSILRPIVYRDYVHIFLGDRDKQATVADGVESLTHDNDLGRSSIQGISILLVEDNAINQMVAISVLEEMGVHVQTCENGQECIDYLRSHPQQKIDIILLDCMMPVMDGYETARQIRDKNAGKAWRDVPIVAMTANAMEGDRKKCLDAGMDEYIAKPFKEKELLKILTTLIK